MSSKVLLPKNVAEAIESLRATDFKVTNWDIVYAFANSRADEYPALIEFANKDFDTFLKALVNGYEVEETPEDKVREYYKATLDKANSLELSDLDSKFYAGEYRGISKTLSLLNIKIEGANA